MKPRKFLGKLSKPDGGGVDAGSYMRMEVADYYHIEGKGKLQSDLEQKKYTKDYKIKLLRQLKTEKRKQLIIFVSIAIVVIFFILFLIT